MRSCSQRRHRSPAVDKAMQGRCPQAPSTRQDRIAGRQVGGELGTAHRRRRARHEPPRARRPPRDGRRRARRGHPRRARGGGPAPPRRRPLPRAPGARHAASRRATARSRSTRVGDGRSESAFRRLRRPPRGQLPRLQPALGRHPRGLPPPPPASGARVPRPAGGHPSSRHGSCARRPPSSSRRLFGTGSAWPGVGRVPVWTSSRPTSSAKNGLPAVASCTRVSSGRVSSRPRRSASRSCIAVTLSGPTRAAQAVAREHALEL